MKELNKPMYYNAKNITIQSARLLRENMTYPEQLLWERLKGKQVLNLRFRRQHPIDFFIVDFYCHKLKLAIEIDGEIHNNAKEYDEGRTAELERYGITVIRFTNYQIENNLKKVIEKIKAMGNNLLTSSPEDGFPTHKASDPQTPQGGLTSAHSHVD